MILIKAGEHVSDVMPVAVKKFKNFLWLGFLIIRQNVNMATNAILYCCVSPAGGVVDIPGSGVRHMWQVVPAAGDILIL